MRKERKPPVRTCVSCGARSDKRELVRLVRTKEGEVFVDPDGRTAGRGAYLCPQSACFETAAAKHRLGPALRSHLTEEDIERLRDGFEGVCATQASSRWGR